MTPLLQLSMQIQCTTWKISEIKDTSNRERHLGHHRKGQLRKGLKVLTCRFIGSKIRDTLKAHESSECFVWNPVGFHSSMKNIQSWLCKYVASRFVALPTNEKIYICTFALVSYMYGSRKMHTHSNVKVNTCIKRNECDVIDAMMCIQHYCKYTTCKY